MQLLKYCEAWDENLDVKVSIKAWVSWYSGSPACFEPLCACPLRLSRQDCRVETTFSLSWASCWLPLLTPPLSPGPSRQKGPSDQISQGCQTTWKPGIRKTFNKLRPLKTQMGELKLGIFELKRLCSLNAKNSNENQHQHLSTLQIALLSHVECFNRDASKVKNVQRFSTCKQPRKHDHCQFTKARWTPIATKTCDVWCFLTCFDELDEFNGKPYQSCAFPVWFLSTFFHGFVSQERWLKNAGTLTRNRKHAQNGYLGNKTTRYLNHWKHGTALWLVRRQTCQRNAPLWSMVAATGTGFVLKVKFHLWTRLNLAARMVYRCLVFTWKWTEPCESPGSMAALCPWLEWMASTRMAHNPLTAVKASFKKPTMRFDHLNVAVAQNVWLPELDPSPIPGGQIPLVGCLCVVRVCLYVLKLIIVPWPLGKLWLRRKMRHPFPSQLFQGAGRKLHRQ